MKKFLLALTTILFSLPLFAHGFSDTHGLLAECAPQRRARPGSMKHTEAEAANKLKTTTLKCAYIRDGATFEGPVYMTGDAGAIKIGDAIIVFGQGHYMLSFDAAKFNIKKYPNMSEQERKSRGLTKHEVENTWERKKLGQDFDYGGKYATIEKAGEKWLILYNGDTDNIYAKIPLNSVTDKSFELEENDMLVKMTLTK